MPASAIIGFWKLYSQFRKSRFLACWICLVEIYHSRFKNKRSGSKYIGSQFRGCLLTVKEEVSALSKGLAVSQVMRDRLDGVYGLNLDEIDGDRPTRYEMFRGLYNIRQLPVVCRPLTKRKPLECYRYTQAWVWLCTSKNSWAFLKPGRWLCSYGESGGSQWRPSVRDALADDRFASVTELNKLRVWHEIVDTMAYFAFY